jgi:hypothetical protein
MRIESHSAWQRRQWRVGWVSRIKSRLRSRENFFLDFPFHRTFSLTSLFIELIDDGQVRMS